MRSKKEIKDILFRTYMKLGQVQKFTDKYCSNFLCSKCSYNENLSNGYSSCLPCRIDRIINRLNVLIED